MPVRELRQHVASFMGWPQAWCGIAFNGRILASNRVVAELFGLKPDLTLSTTCMSIIRMRNLWNLTERSRLGYLACAEEDVSCKPQDSAAHAMAAISHLAW